MVLLLQVDSAKVIFITNDTVVAWESKYIALKKIIAINSGTNSTS